MSNTPFTIYRPATGEIVGRASGNSRTSFLAPDGSLDGVPGSWERHLWYVDPTSRAVLPRPGFTLSVASGTVAANGVSTLAISGVPVGALCSIDGDAPTTITDGTVEFTAAVVGTYALMFSAWPAVPYAVSVTAVAPGSIVGAGLAAAATAVTGAPARAAATLGLPAAARAVTGAPARAAATLGFGGAMRATAAQDAPVAATLRLRGGAP